MPRGAPGLPEWTEQVASFSLEHIAKHEPQAPGIFRAVRTREIQTISFADLLARFQLHSIDVRQIDTEGMDGKLVRWFPFDRPKSAILHFETTHLPGDELLALRQRLADLGYLVSEADASSDDMAVLL